MYARTTTIRGSSQAIDDATAYMRDEVMPAVQQMDGFVGLSFLADRDSGRCIVATAWQTEEAMRATMTGSGRCGTGSRRSWAVGPRCRPGRSPSSTG